MSYTQIPLNDVDDALASRLEINFLQTGRNVQSPPPAWPQVCLLSNGIEKVGRQSVGKLTASLPDFGLPASWLKQFLHRISKANKIRPNLIRQACCLLARGPKFKQAALDSRTQRQACLLDGPSWPWKRAKPSFQADEFAIKRRPGEITEK